jgi:hypothetical protein
MVLGRFLGQFGHEEFVADPGLDELNSHQAEMFLEVIEKTHQHNPWFIPRFIRKALASLAEGLKPENMQQWLAPYNLETCLPKKPMNVGVVMAGNVPLVGFHDLLCVLLSGNRALVKLSSKDDKLLPAVLRVLAEISPFTVSRIQITDDFMNSMDAVIATGSNNSSRYFEYYFRKIPHIIRKNRNSVAILGGSETTEELKLLADDIFTYFGLGCRNVSKLYIPRDYEIPLLLDQFSHYSWLLNHNRYANNYEYYRAIHLVNQTLFLDTGFLVVKEDPSYSSPVGSLYYERYTNPESVKQQLLSDADKIQCIVSGMPVQEGAIAFGTAQSPMLWEYADHIDTMKFLLNLSEK